MLPFLVLLSIFMGIESSSAENLGKTCDAASKCHSAPIELPKDVSYLVFVSFSMPEASLIKLAKDCGPNCRLIIRGLKNNSFKETATLLRKLEIQVDIDPDAFKRFAVTTVPTFVHVRVDKEIARLKGDVTFSFAKEKLDGGV